MADRLLHTFAQVADPFPQVAANSGIVVVILNIVFSIVGALTLLFVVIGGVRYVISQGDPQNTAKAKNTIIYAAIGLAVTLLAATIVNYVVGNL